MEGSGPGGLNRTAAAMHAALGCVTGSASESADGSADPSQPIRGPSRRFADTDGFVLELIGKVVFALGHGSNKNAYALVGREALNVVFDSDHLCLEA